ncbi:MAG TPA: hypothetical protein VG759_21540 [Candidatus Angelobacter sp.]|nr:hypothetical protein [Candidatus Angelobacter sp.]
MPHLFLRYLDWPLILVVAGMMVYRRLYREFPFFFTYLITVASADIVRFMMFKPSMALAYFYAYWVTEAFEVLLGFLVLYEVFLIRLFPQFNVTVIYRWLFPAMGAIVVGLTVWMFLGAPSTGPSKIVTIIGAATMALNFCQVSFLIFFAGLTVYMQRELGRYEAGIGTGFGIHAAVKLFVTGQWVGRSYASARLDQLPTISYLLAILIWLFFLSKSEPKPEETPITKEMVDQADEAYDKILHLLWKDPRRKDG